MSEKEQLKQILQKLWDHGIDAYFVDITLPKFRKLGYYVVKVIIPQLTPFYLNEKVPYFGGTRLYQVPKVIGLQKKVTGRPLNLIPPIPLIMKNKKITFQAIDTIQCFCQTISKHLLSKQRSLTKHLFWKNGQKNGKSFFGYHVAQSHYPKPVPTQSIVESSLRQAVKPEI
jgi:hypothetical protein